MLRKKTNTTYRYVFCFQDDGIMDILKDTSLCKYILAKVVCIYEYGVLRIIRVYKKTLIDLRDVMSFQRTI